VVAVQDSEPLLRDLVASEGYGFPVLMDPGGMGVSYGISVIPTLVLIDASGNIATKVSRLLTAGELAVLVEDLAGR